jgi:signal transduction histidine kinase
MVRSYLTSRATKLVAVLLLTMGLVVALAYEAWDAERSHRATAESVLQDYAAFAAWEYGANIKEEIWSTINYIFAPIVHESPLRAGEELKPASALLRPEAREKLCAGQSPPYAFRIDLRNNQIEFSGTPPGADVQRWIRDTVLADLPHYKRDWSFSTISAKQGGVPYAVVYQVKWLAHRKAAAAYGFEFCVKNLAAPYFQKILQRYMLLPPALTHGIPNDSLMSVVVSDGNSRELYRSSWQFRSAYVGDATLDAYGGIHTKMTLNPSQAHSLIIGGLPRSRLPTLSVLLVIALVLVGSGLVVLRRESELTRLRADFVASVSHELRTPLAQVRMFAETLRLGRVRSTQERERSLAIIEQEARRLTHLVDNVLHFSRAERQGVRLAPRERNLASEISEALVAFAPIAQAREVTLQSELQPDARACIDGDAFRQILLNLFDNAVKYGPVGQTVRVRLTSDGITARIAVEDEGPGIPPAERTRVWAPYYRIDRDVDSAVAGGGIGLSVVHDLVTRHGGVVRIDDSTPRGATLIIELPALPNAGDPTAVPAGNGAQPASPELAT